MFKKRSILLSLLALPVLIFAEETEVVQAEVAATAEIAVDDLTSTENFKPFTGRIAKGKVRLRATPTVDGYIVQELQKGELLLVDGENNSFYQVKSPEKVKGYVFRTFILDGKVEGSRVNVRLAPDLEAPVIAQLNSGETIDGHIYAQNTKWIECTPPETVRFYVASEFIEQAGDINFMALCEERKSESAQLLSSAIQNSALEFEKPFDEIQVEPILSVCNTIINDYADCQEVVARAKDLITQVNAQYLDKKIAYLESKAQEAEKLASRLQEIAPTLEGLSPKAGLSHYPLKLTSWQDIEQGYVNAFKQQHATASEQDFYAFEKEKAITLLGVLTPYLRPVKNKPGDFLLLDPQDNHPVAYLYSTQVNLSEQLGQVIKIVASPRPNNHFAYPAYYVLAIEKN